jgi:hypothetical protein
LRTGEQTPFCGHVAGLSTQRGIPFLLTNQVRRVLD